MPGNKEKEDVNVPELDRTIFTVKQIPVSKLFSKVGETLRDEKKRAKLVGHISNEEFTQLCLQVYRLGQAMGLVIDEEAMPNETAQAEWLQGKE